MMTGTYEIIYADPPWRYSAKKVQGAAENHYPTMSIDELCALPVAELAAKDSALFMWATFPQLPEALRLIRAWGFTYKSVAFVWLKKNKKADSWFYGLGFWTRANAEVCLLATKGHPKRQAADIHQFIISPIEAHSKKPDATRDKICLLYTSGRSRFQSLYQPDVGGSNGDLPKRHVQAVIQPSHAAVSQRTPAGFYAGGHQSRDDTGLPGKRSAPSSSTRKP